MSKRKIYENARDIISSNQTTFFRNCKPSDIKKKFYHYTSVDSLKSILKGDEKSQSFLFLGSLANMNDINEANLHKEVAHKTFLFCACSTDSERIPLWYLYAGISGNGARLCFTKEKMLKFFKRIEKVYPVSNYKVDYSKELKVDQDFELQCGYVYYVKDDKSVIKHNTKYHYIKSFDDELLINNYFIKDYPWEYEKEFRIVIQIKGDEVYEKVAIPIPEDIKKQLKITSAPEYQFSEEEKDEFVSYGIKKENIGASKLTINMNLLRNNQKNIIAQIESWCDETSCDKVCEYIKNKKKCKEEEQNARNNKK